ncbi:MAG TPA: SDR family NAD(P)-dependent oxidoreductase [Leptolyngbyaceae cyanobacterium]
MNHDEILEDSSKIAIVGMVGRFPGAKNIEQFWQNLRDGVESISFFSEEEIDERIDRNLIKNSNYVKANGTLADIELFDAKFFGYSPREAELIDPQSRLFLESAWEALESAGYNSETYPGRIGIYAGASVNTYFLFNLFSNPDLVASVGLEQLKFGNQADLLTTRVAYKLNLKGSGITVQTACSTSLVAVHLACQSLLLGECDMALAGGVSISVPQKAGYLYQEGGIGSPDGHCRAFDGQAQGTISGSGVGIVVLKRLEDAIADGDYIHAIIKGSAINNDGSLKVGYTAPSVEGQANAIAEAQAIAGIEPEKISYIETHGTGTALGDPVEVAALTQAFRIKTNKKGFCAIGSVKTNIGHLNAAAGVTGLIKTILALKNKQIPPSLHFQKPNPQIDFANSPFYVNNTLSEWKAPSPRYAGVSSFGIGGTNAHVILEEAPNLETGRKDSRLQKRQYQLLVLSAKTNSALETATGNLAAYLKQNPNVNLADVAYTLQVGRCAFDYRRVVVCQDVNDGVQALLSLDPQRVFKQFHESGEGSIVFMFPGQGSQYVGMGRELYETESVFREEVDRCCELIQPVLGLDLRSIIYPKESENQTLEDTALVQPVLFVIEYALAKLWISWGVSPEAFIGHSIGEYVAACLAGVFSLEDALKLVAMRGKLMQTMPGGAMLAVSLPAKDVEEFLSEELSLAASNSSALCVVSGTYEAIDNLEVKLTSQGINCRRLHTSHAFHSAMISPILEPFIEIVKQVKLNPPQLPFISNVTGNWITEKEATDPHYWAKHLRQTVRFSEGISTLLKEPGQVLLEVGPGRTLTTFVKRHSEAAQVTITSMRHPQENDSDVAFLLKALGKLWLAGIKIDWSGFYSGEKRYRLPLPTYPFERQRYWIEPQKQLKKSEYAITKKSDISDWFYIPSWKRSSLTAKNNSPASRWLIFVDDRNIGTQISQKLALTGNEVITVSVTDKFSQLGEFAYGINPQNQNDYEALIQRLQNAGKLPSKIVHLWDVSSDTKELNTEFFNHCQNLGFYSLLFLTQALGKLDSSQPLEIAIVTNNVQEVIGDEQICPEKVTVLGISKVIPQEYPHITCRNIDIVIPEITTEQLLAELTASPSDLVVSYRGKYRWVQIYDSIQLNATSINQTRLREKGVYLITGGLGGIGLVLAEYLAKTVQAKLILIGRSYWPEKADWQQWLATHDERDSTSQKIKKLQKLEALGAEVLVISADVGNLEQMQNAIATSLDRFGTIHGVIHTAGVRLFNTIQQSDREQCDRQFYPKVQGLYVLETLLQNRELDFCIAYSSLASILGLLGKAAYPAAHNFIDAFARKYPRWTSINWDNWQTESELSPNKTNELVMTSEEGLAAFKRILSSERIPQVIVSTADLQTRLNQWINHQKRAKSTKFFSFHSRPNLSNTYVAPRNHVEQSLTDIWQQLLGIEQVGIHDNFFELGGDSVLGIQFIARANQAGIQLTTRQVFTHQTIAELAAIANTNSSNQAEQGLVTGSVPLTPIQHWFFEQNQPESHHWNQAVLLETLQLLDPIILEQALQQLLLQHDALRLRFTSSETGWQQVNSGHDEKLLLMQIDLSGLSLKTQQEAIETKASELQNNLNLSAGLLIRVALFNLGNTQRLLIVIHHLAVDIASWRIFIEDLQTAYQQLQKGEKIQLPRKTTSFKQWGEKLQEYARSQTITKDLNYWLNLPTQVSPLPLDYPSGTNTVASARLVSVTLSTAATQILLQEIPAVYRTQIDDVLLAGLVQSVNRVMGISSLLIDLEGNGREAKLDGVNLSRTVGWFTTIYPVLFNLENAKNSGDILSVIKEEIRRISQEGIGYGLGRYLSQDNAIASQLQSLPRPEIIFLYLGQLDQSLPQSALFRLTRESCGPERSLQGIRPHLLQVTGFVTQGQLQLDWTYSENVHRRETIENLAQGCIQALEKLIDRSQSANAVSVTASDFSANKISQKDLSKLLNVASKMNRKTGQ